MCLRVKVESTSNFSRYVSGVPQGYAAGALQDLNRHNVWFGELTRQKTDGFIISENLNFRRPHVLPAFVTCCLNGGLLAIISSILLPFPLSLVFVFSVFLCIFVCFLRFNSDIFLYVFAISSCVCLCPVPWSLASVRFYFPYRTKRFLRLFPTPQNFHMHAPPPLQVTPSLPRPLHPPLHLPPATTLSQKWSSRELRVKGTITPRLPIKGWGTKLGVIPLTFSFS